MNSIQTYKSLNPGKKLVIMGGVHGDETCGVEAIKKLFPNLKITAGQVTFIIGNPKALKKGIRKKDQDLNRMFKNEADYTKNERRSYEYQRAQKIKPYLKECDALLDLHSMNNPKATPFIICEPKSFDVALRLPFNLRACGWDSIHHGSTDSFVNASGGLGICVECGYKNDPQTPRRAESAIIHFLQSMGAINGKARKTRQQTIRITKAYITKKNFKLSRTFRNFEPLRRGTCIGHDGHQTIITSKNCLILFSYDKKSANEQAFLLAEKLTTKG